jgi:hypothetical protein
MISKAERHELLQVIKKRERVLKMHAQERSASLLAEFESHSAKVHSFDDDEVWQKAEEAARAAVEKANEMIADRCLALGIPREFAPHVAFGWAGRGHNAVSQRRDELRRTAKAKITAMEAEATTKIERMSLEAQTELVSKGLESEAAMAFLNAMPDISAMMPKVETVEIQALIDVRLRDRERRALEHRNWN